ncbi:MAG TPA: type II secretion system protein GspK [Rhodanobacteraceae bacterium]|nr:type II secretion system protein GspK [Rhodanobacteraceae bacterium]
MIRHERGTALLLVLWVTVLLAALLIGLAASSRSQGEAALYGAERVRAEYAAEAGLAHAIAGLRAPNARDRWVPDGRSHTFTFDGATVTVAVVDVTGLVDLNAASTGILRHLFTTAGADTARAERLVGAIADWRGGGLPQPGNVAGASRARGSFRSIDQLASLPGMDAHLFARIEDAVTVFSGRGFPDASYAGPLVLASLQGIDRAQAAARVGDRRKRPAQDGAGNGQAFGAAAGGGPLVAGHGGVVERVFSIAEMPDGTRAGVDVTVRLALTGTGARPYKVLDWRADSAFAP